MKSNLTQARLIELLHYDPATGLFTWRVARNGQSPVDGLAGTVTKHGYRRICVDGELLMAQRLAVFYMTGAWPGDDVDHRRGERDDNRWSKLRELTRAENMQNLQGPHRDNRAGLLGVAPTRNRWGAYICTAGKRRYLGTFDTPELAHAAYLSAKRIAHPAGTL